MCDEGFCAPLVRDDNGGNPVPSDAGEPPPDGGDIAQDAGPLEPDAGGGVDAGVAPDSGPGADGGSAADAGIAQSNDAGAATDAGAAADAGSPAEVDGGPMDDGGPLVDADSGPMPTGDAGTSPNPDGGTPDGGTPDGGTPDGGAGGGSGDAGPQLPPGWLHPNWSHRLAVHVDTTGITTTALSNVPVLVRLSNASVDYLLIQNGGEDIRVTDGSNDQLVPHEIDHWDEAGESTIWFLAPTLAPNAVNGPFYIYYGNPDPAGRSDGPGVFTNGHMGVWHLSPDLAQSANTLDDPAVPEGGALDTLGMVGRGMELDGSNDRVLLAEDTDIGQNAAAITASAWVNADAITGSDEWLVSMSTGESSPGINSRVYFSLHETDGIRIGGQAPDGSGPDGIVDSTAPTMVDTWHHVVGIVDFANDTLQIYLDGVFRTSGTIAFTGTATTDSPTTFIRTGSQDHGDSQYLDGTVDEVRISHGVRSADWIRFIHDNMRNGLITLGATETHALPTMGLPPVAVLDAVVVDEDAFVDIDALGNDTDADGHPLQLESFLQPTQGTLVDMGGGILRYFPNQDYNGSDAFNYTMGDGINGSDSETVTITVNPVDDPPAPGDDWDVTTVNASKVVDVLANDSDVDNHIMPLFVAAAVSAEGANLTLNGGGISITYDPPTDFVGNDLVTITVEDPTGRQTDSILEMVVHDPTVTSLMTFTRDDLAGLDTSAGGYGYAVGDTNGDGYLDLWLASGTARLYQNDGDGTFTNTSQINDGYRSGVFGDIDNDGDLDAYTSREGALWQNDGLGNFTNITGSTGFVTGDNVGTMLWVDQNSDGWLDLVLVDGYDPFTSLRLNNKDAPSTFSELSGAAVGLPSLGNSETSHAADYDNDGDLDLFINGQSDAHLYNNNGSGIFTDVTVAAGLTYSISDEYSGSRFFDCDNDGDLDFFVARGDGQTNLLYVNNGAANWDFSLSPELQIDLGNSKGARAGDFDHDGDLDLVVANHDSPNALYVNLGGCTFVNVMEVLNIDEGGADTGNFAVFDYDNDGDLDLYSVHDSSNTNRVWRNNTNGTDFLKVYVAGAGDGKTPLTAIGTRVEVWNQNGMALLAMRMVEAGGGYGDHNAGPLHFGLASAWGGGAGTYRVVATFPSGEVVTVNNVTPTGESLMFSAATVANALSITEPP
jgi:hypothetical protein